MFLGFTVPLLAASSAAAGDDSDKPFYLRSFEHAAPSVQQYRIAGQYGRKNDPFVLSLHFRKGQWNVELSRRNAAPLKLRLDRAYNSIPINRILVATDGEDRNLVALIPFGKPHFKCFANGEDVYDQVVLQETGEVRLEHFPQCDLEVIDLPIKSSAGTLIVGPPSGILKEKGTGL